MSTLDPCVMCGGEIDQAAIASRARVVARLAPGHPPQPPKVCSSCMSRALGDPPTLTLVRASDFRTDGGE